MEAKNGVSLVEVSQEELVEWPVQWLWGGAAKRDQSPVESGQGGQMVQGFMNKDRDGCIYVASQPYSEYSVLASIHPDRRVLS